jgi:hypothetical protein
MLLLLNLMLAAGVASVTKLAAAWLTWAFYPVKTQLSSRWRQLL